MRKLVLCVLLSWACSNDDMLTEKKVPVLHDTIPDSRLIAVCSMSGGTVLFVGISASNDTLLKMFCYEKFPAVYDTLVRDTSAGYRNRDHTFFYFFEGAKVKETFRQKIIHPSSNWQGQSPWQEMIIADYDNLLHPTD